MAPGYWGHPSSTIDWCEDNYAVTHFIAEFWNTVSNVLMIVPPLVSAFLLVSYNLELRLVACHLSLLCVGVGSWCFHMTLLYSMQLLDELPMIWGSAFLIYSLATAQDPPCVQNFPLLAALISYCAVVTFVYILCNIPVFFQIAYSIMVLCLVLVAARLAIKLSWCNKKLLYTGVFAYGLGFFLWNIDNHLCGSLQTVRSYTGVLSPLFELHAWWHILAGIGTYLGLIFISDTRCTVLGHRTNIKYWMKLWPYMAVEIPS